MLRFVAVPDPPHPHQIKIRTLDPHQSDKLDPHQFTDEKPKCMEYETILALFHWFEPLFGR
jgi:hypothetical protein